MATWSQADANGRLVAGQHLVKAVDVLNLATAVNRRRLLVYKSAQDFSSNAAVGLPVRVNLYSVEFDPPFDNFHYALESGILMPAAGGLGGSPPSPTSMTWLWPFADADENKTIVNGFQGVGADQVSLFQKLNGTNDWTDTLLGSGLGVKAVHTNELRATIEFLTRGRWIMPLYTNGAMYNMAPDLPWGEGYVANYYGEEVRSVAFARINTADNPARGLTGVTVRSTSRLKVTAQYNATIAVGSCSRVIDFANDPPTWNEYGTGHSWTSPGGDYTTIGTLTCTANTPAYLTGSALTSALQAMVDGQANNFIFRLTNNYALDVPFTASLEIDFDLAIPPN